MGRLVSRTNFADPVWIGGFSPDLRTAVAKDARETDHSVRLYEVATGRLRHSFDPGEWWYGQSGFSPDGRFLATSHPGTPVLLWDVRGEKSRPGEAAGRGRVEISGARGRGSRLRAITRKAGFAALALFAAFPDQGLATLRAKVPVPVPPDAVSMARLIDTLGAVEFRDREAATARNSSGLGAGRTRSAPRR